MLQMLEAKGRRSLRFLASLFEGKLGITLWYRQGRKEVFEFGIFQKV